MEKFDDRPDSAKRLKSARIARGFETAKDAAIYFNWIYETYQQHESGLRGITPARAAIYGKAYRVSAGWLLTGEGVGPIFNNDGFMKEAASLLPKVDEGDREAVLRVLRSLVSSKDK